MKSKVPIIPIGEMVGQGIDVKIKTRTNLFGARDVEIKLSACVGGKWEGYHWIKGKWIEQRYIAMMPGGEDDKESFEVYLSECYHHLMTKVKHVK